MSAIFSSSNRNRVIGAAALAATAGLALTACGDGSGSVAITGEGATSQQKAMTHFADVLTDNDGPVLDYTGSGSGDGIKKFLNGDVDFAGSDSALKDDEIAKANERCGGNEAWHLPLVAGPVAVAFNLPGVDKLTLDAPTLAKIFDSKIGKWNDPKIAALNPGVNLPDTGIVPVHRSDSSGTTDNFTKFLKNAAPADWPHEPSKEWAGKGGSGAAKSTGVGDTVKKTAGGITYVEWGYPPRTTPQCGALPTSSAGSTELTAETAGAARQQHRLQGAGQQEPGRRHRRSLPAEEPGRLPAAADPVRDRLLGRLLRRGHQPGPQGRLLAGPRQGSGRPGRARLRPAAR